MTPAKRESILQSMSDLHKDAFGYRPSGIQYGLMSDADLQREYDYLVSQVESGIREEARANLLAQRAWEKRITATAIQNNVSFGSVLRWDFQAEDVDVRDPGFYCYLLGLSYDLEHRIKEELKG